MTLGIHGAAITIIGGGAAAHSCATAYREAGGQDALVIVSADDRPPYYRPHLTKEYLLGEIDAGELPLADDDWYDTNGVELRMASVEAIDIEQHRLVIGNETVPWSRLVIATGSAAKPVPAPGGDHPDLQRIRRWTLATKTAHGLYEKFGFAVPKWADAYMDIVRPDIYLSPPGPVEPAE